jgi:hypothetical protein
VVNCIVAGNTAWLGGGMFYQPGDSAVGTTIVFNDAGSGGGLYRDDFSHGGTAPHLDNCIVRGNTATVMYPSIGGGDPDTVVSFSNVEGGWSGLGGDNIDEDPLFVGPAGCDGIPGTPDDDYRLAPGSPSIDSGSDALLPVDELDLDDDGDVMEPLPLDLRGALRRTDGDADGTATVDMGAFENVDEDEACCGDLDGSGAVDIGDLLALLGAWGTADGDVTGDGTTDVADLLVLLAAWGSCTR